MGLTIYATTTRETAAILGCSRDTLRRALRVESPPVVYVGKRGVVHWHVQTLREWVQLNPSSRLRPYL